MEVKNKANVQSTQSQICQQLGLVNRHNHINAFQLDHDGIIDHYVHSIAALQPDALVDDRKWDLAGDPEIALLEFVAEAFFVRRFEKPGAEVTMHLDGSAD